MSELYEVLAFRFLQHELPTHLVRCVSRIRSSVDTTTPYDAKHQNRIVDAVEGMNEHRVSLPDASVVEPSDQLSNQHLCL